MAPRLDILRAALVKAGVIPRVRAGCVGKQKHKSQGAAESQIRALLKRTDYVYGEDTLNTYRCRTCGFWHVGHAPWLAAS